jgi:ABC-2 type transport system ATP-binding protein
VLYLDEPSIGLDVSVKARFRDFIRAMHRERGLTVMLTSHDLGDIEELCERLIMIDRGRIVYDGALAEITDRFGWERTLRLELAEPAPGAGRSASEALGSRPGVAVAQPSETELTIAYDGRTVTSGALIRDLATRVPMADIEIRQPSAESIIRQLYEGTLRFDEPEGAA